MLDTSNGLIVSPASGSVTSITLSFENAMLPGIENASLPDGYWQLGAAAISFPGGTTTDIRRLFGDINNDGMVDGAVDFPVFGADSNSTFTSPGSPFDFNNDGTVDGALDFPAFGARFNVSL